MSIVSGICKRLYWPICRAYAKHILGDKPADALFRSLCTFQFWAVNRYWPNFKQPRSFAEKLWSRMLHERDPVLTLISDKLRVRDYVASKVGSEYLIPMLWSGERPEQIPFDELPSKFVIKANHGCGYNIIVKDKTQLNQTATRRQLKKWLGENFCEDKYLGIGWGYKHIIPSLMIESFLEENGEPPTDYKFWCFSGLVECITVHFDRLVNQSVAVFDKHFEPSPFNFGPEVPPYSRKIERPLNLDTMIQVAESLASGFGFMRVDLYNLNANRIFFGELTPYTGGVSMSYHPTEMDYLLGEKWI